jgi:hypothetical protein
VQGRQDIPGEHGVCNPAKPALDRLHTVMRLYSIVMPSQLAMDMQVCEWWGCSSVLRVRVRGARMCSVPVCPSLVGCGGCTTKCRWCASGRVAFVVMDESLFESSPDGVAVPIPHSARMPLSFPYDAGSTMGILPPPPPPDLCP